MRLLSPVYFKELAQVANRRRTYVARTVYLLAIFSFLSLSWLSQGVFTADRMNINDAARFGRMVFFVIIWTEFAAAALFTPAFTANLLTGERSANTLGLLFLTRLRSWNIVQDKGLSRITYMAQYLLLSVPFLFVCLMFGGITTRQIIISQAAVFSVVLVALSFSLFFSTVLRNFFSALSAAYVVLFSYLVLLPLIVFFLSFAGGMGGIPPFLAWTNPLFSMTVIMEPDIGRSMGAGIEYSWIGPLAFGVVCYVLSVGLSSIILPRTRARFQVQSARPGLAGIGQQSAFRVLLRVPFLPFVLLAELLDWSRIVRRNPVYWRESGLIGRSGRMSMVYMTGILGYAYVILAALVVLNAEGRAGDDLFQCTASYFVLAILFVGLFIAVTAGSSIASEREENTLDTFLSTRYLNRSFVLGKFFGVLRSSLIHALLPIALVIMAHAVHEKGTFWVAALGLLVMGVYFAWVAALGIALSSASPSPARAVSFTVGCLLVICLGVPILAGVSREYVGRDASKFLLTLTPGYWAGALAIDPKILQSNAWNPEKANEELLKLIIGMAVYTSATVVLLLYAVRRFRSLTGRK